MKNHSVSERGQVLVLIALAIIGLVGITGVAIDGSMILADRRHAQNAADTAALAGALEYIQACGLSGCDTAGEVASARYAMKVVAKNRADSNGYTGDLIRSEVEVYSCDEVDASCPAPYASDKDYLQVIITSHVDTFFARVLGVSQLHNRVQAIALADDDDSGPLGNGEGIVSYAPTCTNPENFKVEGNTLVKVEGAGLFANVSDPSCGVVCNSNGPVIQGDITTAGGIINLANSCLANYDSTTYDQSTTGSPLDFPIYIEDLGLEVPPECDGPVGSYNNYSAGATLPSTVAHYDYPDKGSVPVTVLHPGRYGQFPPPKDSPALKLEDTMLMEPGTYCVSDVIRWSQPKFVLVGEDVTIYIRAGYDFQFTGGMVDIDAPNTGDYAGYLIIVEPDYGNPELSESPEACKITGGVENDYEGSIFAPYCDCELNGGGSTSGFNAQLLCYTVKVTGGGTITLTYNSDLTGAIDDPAKTGVTK